MKKLPLHILHIYTLKHTPCLTLLCKQDSMCLRTGMSVPINLKCEQQRKPTVYSALLFLQGYLSIWIVFRFYHKEKKSGQKQNKKKSHCCSKMSLSFVSCTFQNNTINAKFIQGGVLKKKKKTQHGATIIL